MNVQEVHGFYFSFDYVGCVRDVGRTSQIHLCDPTSYCWKCNRTCLCNHICFQE